MWTSLAISVGIFLFVFGELLAAAVYFYVLFGGTAMLLYTVSICKASSKT